MCVTWLRDNSPTANCGHREGIHRGMKEGFRFSLKIAGKVMEEPSIWMKGRESSDSDVSQAITLSPWEVVET